MCRFVASPNIEKYGYRRSWKCNKDNPVISPCRNKYSSVWKGVHFYSERAVVVLNLNWLHRYTKQVPVLHGSLPTSFSRLNKLQILEASGHFLSGIAPWDEYKILNNLKVLQIYDNFFYGLVPPISFFMRNMDKLVALDLSRNSFSGDLNNGLLLNASNFYFANNSGLKYLSLSNNFFNGSIPAYLGEISSLTNLDLRNNFWWEPKTFTNFFQRGGIL